MCFKAFFFFLFHSYFPNFVSFQSQNSSLGNRNVSVLLETVLLSGVITKHASGKLCTVLLCIGGAIVAIACHKAQTVCLFEEQEDSSLQ